MEVREAAATTIRTTWVVDIKSCVGGLVKNVLLCVVSCLAFGSPVSYSDLTWSESSLELPASKDGTNLRDERMTSQANDDVVR